MALSVGGSPAALSPLAPSLETPANGLTKTPAAGLVFKAQYHSADRSSANAYALRVKTSEAAAYLYFNVAINGVQSTIAWNACAVATGTSLSVTVPEPVFAGGDHFNWSMAFQEAAANLSGPFASTFVVTVSDAPSLVVTGPSGNVATGCPTVRWTASAATGASFSSYRVRVFTTAQAGVAGFTPATSPCTWDSGMTAGNPSQVTVSVTLANGITYVAYVQVTETGTLASPWKPTTFTVAFDAPAAPSIGAEAVVPASGAPVVALSLEWVRGTFVGTVRGAVQFSDTGNTWADLPTGSTLTLVDGAVTVDDVTAPHGVLRYYRAKVRTADGVASPWSATVSAELPAARWWLIDPQSPSSAIGLRRAQMMSATMPGISGGAASIDLVGKAQSGSFATFGRSTYVTVNGTVLEPDFTLTMNFFSEAEWQAFLALWNANKKTGHVMLVKSDMPGVLYWVNFGPTRPEHILRTSDRTTDPKRQCTVHCNPATPIT